MNDDFTCPNRDSTCNKHKNAPKEKKRGKRGRTMTGEEEGGEEGEEKEGPRMRGEGLEDTVGGQGGQQRRRRLGWRTKKTGSEDFIKTLSRHWSKHAHVCQRIALQQLKTGAKGL